MPIWKFLRPQNSAKGCAREGTWYVKFHLLHCKNSPLLNSDFSFLLQTLRSSSRGIILQHGQSDSPPMVWESQSLQVRLQEIEPRTYLWDGLQTHQYHPVLNRKVSRSPMKAWEPSDWQRSEGSCWLFVSQLHLTTDASLFPPSEVTQQLGT